VDSDQADYSMEQSLIEDGDGESESRLLEDGDGESESPMLQTAGSPFKVNYRLPKTTMKTSTWKGIAILIPHG
jgi:hypothetical protein